MALRRRWTDIAVNLTDGMFRGVYHGKQVHAPDEDLVLKRALDAGVYRVIVTGTSLTESRAAIDLCREHDASASGGVRLQCTVGCHPTRCSEFDDANGGADSYSSLLDGLLSDQALRDVVVAVGECGLDYDREQFCPRDVQLRGFERQLDLAAQTRLPMFLHCRNTAGDFNRVMRQHRHRITGGVVHSFDGSAEEMRELTQELDLYIGVNGCSLKTEANLAVVAQIPLNRLLLETDAPYCDLRQSHASYKRLDGGTSMRTAVKKEKYTPGAMVRSRNEPCTVLDVARVVACVHGIDMDVLAEAVQRNTSALFGP